MTEDVSGEELERIERLSRLLGLQTLLAHVAREIGPGLELHAVVQAVVRAMRSLMDFRGGSILLVDGRELYVAAADPPLDEPVASLRIPIGTALAGRAVADGRTIYSPDLDNDDRVDRVIRNTGSNRNTRSFLCVPLVCLGEVIGALEVHSEKVDAFDDVDRTVLEGLATQMAGAIESARRYEAILDLERQKNDFIGRISHELRTPMTIMTGFVSTLLAHDNEFGPEDRRAMLERTLAAIDRLSDLIDELLLVQSFEAGMSEAIIVDTDVAPILEQIKAEAVDPDRVRVTCPAGVRERADPKLLKQALHLLVDNAMKYGGNAELTAVPGEIAVRDHGPGIPPELGDRVFERFVRGSTSKPGMGLGLPLVRSLCAAMDATVTLETPADGGACFRIRFAPT
ncbi:MAG: GAF domain-containing sensor histidine kinase [Acidimicrobiia bacterium]|nr:GAF domain-containing sensor histidine kinase [Acidimicrobiia bacterium]